MLRRQGDWGPALDAYRAAVATQERLGCRPTLQPELERDLLMGRQRVGDMLLKQGESRGGRGRPTVLRSPVPNVSPPPSPRTCRRNATLRSAWRSSATLSSGRTKRAGACSIRGFARHRRSRSRPPIRPTSACNGTCSRATNRSATCAWSKAIWTPRETPSRPRSPLPSRWRRPIRRTAWRSAS